MPSISLGLAPRARLVVGNAYKAGICAEDISGLHNIHSFSFGYAFFDVEEYYLVSHLIGNKHICTSSAYIAGAYHCNFRHSFL